MVSKLVPHVEIAILLIAGGSLVLIGLTVEMPLISFVVNVYWVQSHLTHVSNIIDVLIHFSVMRRCLIAELDVVWVHDWVFSISILIFSWAWINQSILWLIRRHSQLISILNWLFMGLGIIWNVNVFNLNVIDRLDIYKWLDICRFCLSDR